MLPTPIFIGSSLDSVPSVEPGGDGGVTICNTGEGHGEGGSDDGETDLWGDHWRIDSKV